MACIVIRRAFFYESNLRRLLVLTEVTVNKNALIRQHEIYTVTLILFDKNAKRITFGKHCDCHYIDINDIIESCRPCNKAKLIR